MTKPTTPRPRNTKLDVYIHVGLGKAGSTSIQNGFLAQSEDLIKHHGIHYAPSGSEFNNDYAFFSHLIAGDRNAARDYIKTRIAQAKAVGAKKVLISCEDLMGVPYHPDAFETFKTVIQTTKHARFHLIVVVRKLQEYLRSNLVQMMRAGATLYDNRMAAWIVDMIRAYAALGLPTRTLSLDDPLVHKSLVNSFLGLMSHGDFALEERRDNATPKRPETFHAILGQILRLEANIRGVHPNGPLMSPIGGELEDLYDSFHIWDGPTKRYCSIGSAHHFVAAFELRMQAAIEHYITAAMEGVTAEDLAYYNLLLDIRLPAKKHKRHRTKRQSQRAAKTVTAAV